MTELTTSQKTDRYLLDNISNDGYSDEELKTDQDKVNFICDTFFQEYGWSVPRYGLQKAVTEWLQGLPSTVNIVFYNHDILKLYREWGLLKEDATESKEDNLLEYYWKSMGHRLALLIKKGLNYDKHQA